MTKPNIVWIYCDELRADALGCYGNPYMDPQTPHIDAMAESGIQFENCYCNSPVCVPSRMSTLTGLYPEDTGVYHNEAFWPNFKLEKPVVTFPEILQNSGYQTATFGKTHIPRELTPWPWEIESMRGSFHGELFKDINAEDLGLIQTPGKGFVIGGHYPGDRPYPPEQVTNNGLSWLNETEGPFLVRFSYLQPHTPVIVPPPFDRLYESADFPDQFEIDNNLSLFEKRFAQIVGGTRMKAADVVLAQQYYYGLVAWIDSQVGRIMDHLKEKNLIQNTIIIFESDHGVSLGENGCYAKHIFAPQVHRVPRLISWPGALPQGQRRFDLCEGLDLPKTLFALTGVASPSQFKGRDLFRSESPETVFSTIGYGYEDSRAFPNAGVGEYSEDKGWPRRVCIRTPQFRLDKNTRINGRPVKPEEEDIFLVDVQQDPEESTNLADKPEHKTTKSGLLKRLDDHISQAVEPPRETIASESNPHR